MSLPKQDFLDRVVSHILPTRFRRVRMSGLYATNEHARLAIARAILAARREPSGLTLCPSDPDQDSLQCEFSGDREGLTTYRVRCQKCIDQPPMHTEYRIAGHDTMRFLAFIIAMQMYLSGKRSRPPEPRPRGLPDHFARLEDLPRIEPSPTREQEATASAPTATGRKMPPLIEARPP